MIDNSKRQGLPGLVRLTAMLASTVGVAMDYDEELHTAWVKQALQLAMDYREAEPGREVRDAMRAMKAHFEGRPASMDAADAMDKVAQEFAHRLAMNLECLILECPASARFYDEAATTLGAYRSAMNAIHESLSPTHMGEPVVRGIRAA